MLTCAVIYKAVEYFFIVLSVIEIRITFHGNTAWAFNMSTVYVKGAAYTAYNEVCVIAFTDKDATWTVWSKLTL